MHKKTSELEDIFIESPSNKNTEAEKADKYKQRLNYGTISSNLKYVSLISWEIRNVGTDK